MRLCIISTHLNRETCILTLSADSVGVELPQVPPRLETSSKNEHLIVADMSSKFLNRRVNVSKSAVLFGGAQKVRQDSKQASYCNPR